MIDEKTLFLVHRDHLDKKEVKRNNRYKKYKYGFNNDLDCVVISRDGTVGDIYEIQGLRIAIPKTPKEIDGQKLNKQDQVWMLPPRPSSLNKIKSMADFYRQPESLKQQYYPYIEQEWERRDNGYWFMCNGEPTYITGSNYFFLTWSHIDTESTHPDWRQPNRIFHYFLEATKADYRCFGLCYLKNRRSGFSHIAASETVNLASRKKNASFGILSKTGADAKELFVNKLVPKSSNLPFFFRPYQAGMDKPKTVLEYAIPSVKLSKKSLQAQSGEEEDLEGLNTTIEWKNTGSNAFDGFKLAMLVHDESGKWEKPHDVKKNWEVTQTCLRLGSKIVGKVMMGSTSNRLDAGGQEFKDLYYAGDLTRIKRNRVGRTPSGMYSFFINALWGFEGFFDKYGWPVLETPKNPVTGVDGEDIYIGVKDYWQAEVDGLKEDPDRQNEFYRQFPLTEKHAFRDEATDSLFNLTKIYEQIDYNEEMVREGYVTTGSFQWKGGKLDSAVEFYPNKKGRFKIAWLPPHELRNNVEQRHGVKYPANNGLGAFGCDPYDISGTVGGRGSKGALTGVTTWNMDMQVPNNMMFLEYVARPQTAEIFFEDVLMALVFYGMPALIENNKPRLLYHLKRRGYRGFAMNRPDKSYLDLSKTEKELGGIPNNSEDIKQAHASAIESWIQDHVGLNDQTEEMGRMYFNKTLEDWARFDISDRTAHDESISSGLAFMACQKFKYRATAGLTTAKIVHPFGTYQNKGNRSILNK